MELEQRLTRSYIPALDGIRGISAFLVFSAHADVLPRQYGALGVAVFFVLSGFLITWLLLKESATGSVSLRRFYIRRTLRIFPAFYLFWFVCVGCAVIVGTGINRSEVMSSLLYVGDYYNALKSSIGSDPKRIMGITWSLGVEEKFYLIWPWVFAKYRHDLPKLLRLVAAAICLVWMYRITVLLLGITPVDYLRYAFESRVDNILYGCLLALIVKNNAFSKIMAGAAKIPFLPVLLAGGLATSVWLEDAKGPAFHYLVGMTIDAVLITLLLALLIMLSATPMWSWLETPLLRFTGRVSYSFYLYHFTMITLAQHFLSGARWSVQLVAALASTLIVASLSYICVERPFLLLKDRFAAAAPRVHEAVAAGS